MELIFIIDGNFIKSKNKTLNEWLIQNDVYVHDDLSHLKMELILYILEMEC